MLETRKLPRRSMSLLDRLNKSDVEEKSLSNDESPLPSCPRQPPDGVETPSEAIEKAPDLPTQLPPRLSTGWCGTRPRYSYSSRKQDARSEASVKDKIAMFSVESTIPSGKMDKCSTLPTRSQSTVRKSIIPKSNYSDISSLDRRLTKSQDNLDDPIPYKRQTDRPEAVGALKNNNSDATNKMYLNNGINSKPLFYGSTTTLPSDSSFNRSVYHVRSMSDENNKEDLSSFKSNLDYLIEQRKKSMSKLRGLVIPEVQAQIVDLPEIKIKDTFPKTYTQNTGFIENRKVSKPIETNRFTSNDNKWKTNFTPSNLPKYSPAFKRKSLQVYTSLSKEPTPERKLLEKTDNKIGNYSSILKPTHEYMSPTFHSSNKGINKDYHKSNLNNIMQNFDIKICTATDIVDSDNDSAMSSTQSSYRSSASSPMYTIETVESDSSRLSPRISNYTSYSLTKNEVPIKNLVVEKNCDDYIKSNICRSVSSETNISLSSSAGSAATSGSQASCSSLESSVADSDKRKVSKVYNVDTINRRNILASAKCRSGRDAKLKSPVLETKFSQESYNRSPSPTENTPERLSTLTSAVSAIANKGENRRRNMAIVESDSDTGSENNVRLRKPEYKNNRLKRNLSSSKQKTDVNSECKKVNEIPVNTKNDKVEITKHFDKQDSNKEVKLSKSFTSSNNKLDINVTKPEPVKEKFNGFSTHNQMNGMVKNNSNIVNGRIISKDLNVLPTVTDKNRHDATIQTFRLLKGVGSGIGLILAGGIDCEAKDVTVHRVLSDSIAAKAGIKRGSKVRSINGCTMTGLTHAESVTILKAQRAEVVIEIENENSEKGTLTDCGSEDAESKLVRDANAGDKSSRNVVTVLLEKAGGGAGLGFGLDGGRDSPLGDRPLTIKKLFSGGAAAQSGSVLVGAELLSAGGQSMEGFTRTQAWAALKALPPGPVALILRNP